MGNSQYEAFVRTVELGSLTAAAEDLGYTQSGITHLLNALEGRLGMRLVNRSRSGVTLTSSGELLLLHVRAVLRAERLLSEQVNDMRGLQDGLVRIGTFASASAQWLPGMIRAFKDDHPGIRFELLHGTNDDNERWLREGRVDLAFVRLPAAPGLQSTHLLRDPIVVVVPAQSDLARQPGIAPELLSELPYIALSEGVDDEMSELLRERGVRPNTQFVERDDYAVMAMVEQGLGVSLMPQLVLAGSSRDIAAVPLDPAGWRDLGIAYGDERQLSVAAHAFLECATRFVLEVSGSEVVSHERP